MTTPAASPRRREAAAGSSWRREVQDELRRLGDRWQSLPRTQALACSGRLLALAQSLADRVAEATGAQPATVPDLGPAVVLDQVRVLVYDASRAGCDDGLAEALAAVRRDVTAAVTDGSLG